MKEVVQGTNIFWHQGQKLMANSAGSWKEYVSIMLDIFFDKEVLAKSCAKGTFAGRRRSDTVPLPQAILNAIIGEFINNNCFCLERS